MRDDRGRNVSLFHLSPCSAGLFASLRAIAHNANVLDLILLRLHAELISHMFLADTLQGIAKRVKAFFFGDGADTARGAND